MLATLRRRLGMAARHLATNNTTPTTTTSPTTPSSPSSSTASPSSLSQPTATAPLPVITRKAQNMRMLLLNRGASLNALNLSMIRIMAPQIKAWDESDLTKSIVLTSMEGSKAFCAGGDVKEIVKQIKSQNPTQLASALKFFQEEYELNHLIATAKKPFIAVMNGITMGGGVGISVHAPFRIVTENTVFAMPECDIGLFPDVGGSFFLSRLDGELGTYLGLTGHRLKGEEVFMAGIGTHYIPSDRLLSLLTRLSDIETDEIEVINMALEEYVGETSVDMWRNWSLGGQTAEAINRTFKYNTIDEIVAALQREKSDWATKTLEILKKKSPTSLRVTLEQLRRGRELDFASCMRMEYTMVQEFLRTHDFIEGVTARLMEKPARAPKWSPTWEESSTKLTRTLINDAFFSDVWRPTNNNDTINPESSNSTLPSRSLKFFNNRTFYEYPHKTLSGLPNERDIEAVIAGKIRRGVSHGVLKSADDVMSTFTAHWGGYDSALMGSSSSPSLPRTISIENGFGRGKSGLIEKVNSVLERRRMRGLAL